MSEASGLNSDTAAVTVNVQCPSETTGSNFLGPTSDEAEDFPEPLNNTLLIAYDDFYTTSQGSSVVLFVLANDTLPAGKKPPHILF